MLELPDDEKEKTLTLKRDKSIAKDQKKLEEMRKKLHTEDDSRSFFKTTFYSPALKKWGYTGFYRVILSLFVFPQYL